MIGETIRIRKRNAAIKVQDFDISSPNNGVLKNIEVSSTSKGSGNRNSFTPERPRSAS
jgi:hypothetical protein